MPLLISSQKNRSRRTILKVPPEIDAAIYFIGRIKSGKSCSMRTICEKYHDIRGTKIMDMGGDERAENLYWALPSNKQRYWEILEKYLGKFETPGPKQYKVNILYPMFMNRMPKELPYNPPYVRSTIFTIPFREINAQQIELVINNMAENAKFAWRELVQGFNKKSTTADLLFKSKKIESQILYKNFIKPLCDEQLLQSDDCFLNLNIKKELKDRETITVLSLDYIPDDYHIFVSDYILHKTKELFKAGELNKNSNILFAFREVSRYFRATEMSSTEDRYKKFRTRLSDYLRYARIGMHFFFDTQDLKECKGLVDGQQDMTFIGRIGESESNREMLIQPLLRDKRITTKQAEELKYNESGEMTIVTAGIKSVQPVYVTLPRTMFWEESSGNFYKDVWANYIDKWEPIDNIKEEVYNKFKIRYDELKEEHRRKKENEKLKKALLKDEEKEEKKVKDKPSKTKLQDDDLDEDDIDDIVVVPSEPNNEPNLLVREKINPEDPEIIAENFKESFKEEIKEEPKVLKEVNIREEVKPKPKLYKSNNKLNLNMEGDIF